MTTVVATPSTAVEPRRRFSGIVLAAALVAVAAANGGYFGLATAAATLAASVVAMQILTLGVAAMGRMQFVLPASLLLLALFEGIRGQQSPSRALLYALAAFAVILSGLNLRATGAAVAASATLVSSYALATRLLPERLGEFDSVAQYRLAAPLGYWNALGVVCAVGVLLALGFVGHGRTALGRALAGAALPALTMTLYFTFSRGAWIALATAFLVVLAFESRRLDFVVSALAVVPVSAVGVLLSRPNDALTTVDSDLAAATQQGHRLALWLFVLTAVSASAAAAVVLVGNRWAPSRLARRGFVASLGVGLALLLVISVARFGAPWTVATDAYDSFTSPPPRVQNLNDRLFTFSSNGRIELWGAAWENYKDHPLTGSGAGTFEQYWLENRDVGLKVRDAHSLYLETLSELGPLGLALLLLALGVPVYAAFKARGHPLVPAAFGAYVAYLVHAGVDWDWEMPAVTLTALFIGASIVVAARKPEDEEKTMSPRLRYGLLAGTLALAAVAFVGLVGNIALAQSDDEARAGDWDASESKARRAETWAPWSPEPWQRIGEAQLGRGELANARESFWKAIAKDERDWSLWLDLARASEGRAQLAALAQATKLNPLSPELAQLRKELAEFGTIEVGG